jgi:hypothetical protein
MGLSVDQLGTYTAGWMGAALLLAFSALLSFRVPSGTIIAKA